MTPEEREELAKLEEMAARLTTSHARVAGGIRWACALVRRLAGDAPDVAPQRDEVLARQAARIVELESMLGLTPEAVLAAERGRQDAKDRDRDAKNEPKRA